jgi:hypothetical protein
VVNGEQGESQQCAVASWELVFVVTTASCGAPAK